MEYLFLIMYRSLIEEGVNRIAVLESDSNGATVGLASISPDKRFPGTSILDLFVHPNFASESTQLLTALFQDTVAGKIQAYTEPGDTAKIAALEDAGFTRETLWQDQIRLDTGVTDLAVYSR